MVYPKTAKTMKILSKWSWIYLKPREKYPKGVLEKGYWMGFGKS